MSEELYDQIISGIKDGSIVPYLGAGALSGSISTEDQSPIPADSDSLILAMNDGRPMAPKLMWEFPRAAMNLELKKGRSFITKFLTKLYGEKKWTRALAHDWLASIKAPYVIDINRDLQLQETYSDVPHNLIHGAARIGGTDYRFIIYTFDGSEYKEIEQTEMDMSLPLLFKPMGSPTPKPSYIASDADYVDYITELMGGFAIPDPLKEYRKDKKYLFMGMRFNRDTERMVMSDMIYAADKPVSGWALLPDANEKEKRFLKKMGVEVIDADIADFIGSVAPELAESAA